jgi:hypothetical protein
MPTVRKYKDAKPAPEEASTGLSEPQAPAPASDATSALSAQAPAADAERNVLVEQLADMQRAEREPPKLSERKRALVEANPHLLQCVNLLGQLHGQLMQMNVPDDSPEYEEKLTRLLNSAGIHVNKPGAPAADLPPPPARAADEPFSIPQPPRSEPMPPSAPAEPAGPPVSAPVSRGAQSYTSRAATIPSQVTLSPQEREMAKLSGISETQYAANKLRLLQAKAAGMYPDHQ